MGFGCISLYQQNGIFIEIRKINLEKLDDSGFELYNCSALICGGFLPPSKTLDMPRFGNVPRVDSQ
jgi:hypothetical protein